MNDIVTQCKSVKRIRCLQDEKNKEVNDLLPENHLLHVFVLRPFRNCQVNLAPMFDVFLALATTQEVDVAYIPPDANHE